MTTPAERSGANPGAVSDGRRVEEQRAAVPDRRRVEEQRVAVPDRRPVEEQRAAAYLSRVAEPGSLALWSLVSELGYSAAAEAVRRGLVSDQVAAATDARRHLDTVDDDLDAALRNDIELVTPSDGRWPHFALAAMRRAAELALAQRNGVAGGAARGGFVPPIALWIKGPADPAQLGLGSVAVVGSRAATSYGMGVATDLGYGLARSGKTVVSGGAFGIDVGAHRGCLAADGVSVLVSAGGLDRPYPLAHRALYEEVRHRGLLVSEHPPGCAPQRQRFLTRNRLIAAFASAVVVVEAGHRSGALSTASAARTLGVPVLAIPGPVTSAMSTGCHALLTRDDNPAWLVTGLTDVLRICGPSSVAVDGAETSPDVAAGERRSEGLSSIARRDTLSPQAKAVLDGFPSRSPATEAELSRRSGQPIGAVIAALPTLLDAELIRGGRDGYRLA